MRRKAVTLTELLIAIAILGILAGTMSLSQSAVGKQTAKREAERVAGYIQTKLAASDRTHDGLWFTIDEHRIALRRGRELSEAVSKDQPLDASAECSFTAAEKKLCYRITERVTEVSGFKIISADSSAKIVQGDLAGYRITVNGADGKTCDVVIGTN